jgi:hypothetical protein
MLSLNGLQFLSVLLCFVFFIHLTRVKANILEVNF